MEKSQAQKQNKTQDPKQKNQKPQQQKQTQITQESKRKINGNKHHLVWDCGSTLYDSFELNSFNRQLDSAIHSRTMSMPHLADTTRAPPNTLPPPPPVSNKKPSSKFSRSIQKLFKSMFRFNKQSSSSSVLWLKQRSSHHEEYYVVYDKTGALTTIPEVPEIDFGGLSPEINSLVVKRTSSERFTAASTVGISCA